MNSAGRLAPARFRELREVKAGCRRNPLGSHKLLKSHLGIGPELAVINRGSHRNRNQYLAHVSYSFSYIGTSIGELYHQTVVYGHRHLRLRAGGCRKTAGGSDTKQRRRQSRPRFGAQRRHNSSALGGAR